MRILIIALAAATLLSGCVAAVFPVPLPASSSSSSSDEKPR